MSELHLPWLELAIAMPLFGAAWVSRLRDPRIAQKHALAFCLGTLALTLGAWFDFYLVGTFEARDWTNFISQSLGGKAFVLDELSAPLIALVSLVFLLTVVSTPRAKARRFSFSWTLVSESILLATFACKSQLGIVVLLAVGTIPPLIELRSRQKPTRVFVLHMGLFVVLLTAGWLLASSAEPGTSRSVAGVAFLLLAVFVRSGIVPFHCWMTDLFEHVTFGTALLFVTPMAGAYAAMRLIVPIAPDWALRGIALTSLVTAVYAAGMALVQHEARRFFCYLFISHSALVLVGLETATPLGLTGALSVWLSVGLSITGFGLTMRSMEARTGRLSLRDYHGLYEHAPTLAALFLLTGLASIGFPGTFGFAGSELLVEGAVEVYPYVGMTVILAAALNGIAVLQAYFTVFTGTRHTATISLPTRPLEQLSILVLAFLILGGGLYPQPGIASRYHAATELVRSREALLPDADTAESRARAERAKLNNDHRQISPSEYFTTQVEADSTQTPARQAP